MKTGKFLFVAVMSMSLIFSGCSLSRTVKGGAIGTAAGGAAGAVIGRTAGNTAVGAVIGAAIGGAAGAIIGNKMDKQAKAIENKIPDVKVERVGEGIVVEFKSDILFGFDSYALSPLAKENLDNLVIILNDYSDTDISIIGHTDSKGSKAYNQALSERRSRAVSNYLAEKNIANPRLSSIGYGEEQPKISNETDSGRSQNRRVEFVITANEKMKLEAQREAENK